MRNAREFSGLLLISLLVLCTVASMAQQIPATYFGMHTIQPTTHWPTVSIGAVRPASVSWAAIETSRGVYNWTRLDAWVTAAENHGVEFNYVFLNVPQWASSNPTQACYAGNVGCAAPPADSQYLAEFVTALVTRYQGKINSYELWNEPNDAHYWTGTTPQLLEMAQQAYNIIKAIDPAAKVLSPAPTWTSAGAAWQWMDQYLAAGGGQFADVIAYHAYTGNANGESVLTIVDNMKAVMAKYGITAPAWITEGGWGTNTYVPDADAQAAFLAQRYLLIWPRGARRFYWYEWDSPNWGTLWDSTTGIHKAGTAYQQVSNWMIGATASPCVKASDSTWTCELTRNNGYQAEAVWNAMATATLVAPAQFTRYRDLSGNTYPLLAGGTVTVGNLPILMENQDPSTAPFLTLHVSSLSGTAPLTVAVSITANPSGYRLTSPSLLLGDGTVMNVTATTYTFTNPGTYTVTGTAYDLSGNLMSATATVTVTPLPPASVPPDFAVSPTAPQLTIRRGQSGTLNFTVTATGGFSGPVALACGNLPVGVTCNFVPNTVNPAGTAVSSTLTVSVAAATQSAGLERRALRLAVLFVPGLVLLGNSKKKKLLALAVIVVVAVLSGSGCGGAVSNTTTGSAAVYPPQASTAPVTYTVTLSATSGALQHNTPITLTVP